MSTYFLILILLSLHTHNLSSGLMVLSSMVDVLSLECSLEFDVWVKVDASGELVSTGSVTGLSVSLPKHVLTLNAWHVTTIA